MKSKTNKPSRHINVNYYDDDKKFKKDLEYYRGYFLDPKGSNAKSFFEGLTALYSKLIGVYTSKNFEAKITLKGENKTKRKTKNSLNSQDLREVIKMIGEGKKEDNDFSTIHEKVTRMPYEGNPIEKAEEFFEKVIDNSMKFNERNIAQMHPHSNIPSYYAGIVGKFINENSIAEEVSRLATPLENQCVSWLANEFGYKPDSAWMYTSDDEKINPKLKEHLKEFERGVSSGNITVGGTTANLAALLVARNKAFQGVAKEGLDKKGVVLGSEYSHYSIEKLCGYVGLGSDNFKKVRTVDKKILANDDREGSLKNKMWGYAKEGKRVVAIVATAGTTETGNIDDLEGISKLIDDFEKEYGYRPHLHVDAAHGGGFVLHDKFNPKKGGLLKGIEKADSITVDPHKMLYTHYSAGCILFKNKKDHKLLKQDADYLFKNDEKNNLGQYRVEGSMGIEGSLQTYASLFFLGKKGFQVIQEHALRNTEYLAKKIKAEKNFEICNEPEMNILCFRYCNPNLSIEVNDEINKKAQKILYDRGNVYIANDKLLHRKDGTDEGRKIEVFRSVIMHPYTTRRDIDVAVKEVKKCVSEVINDMKDSLSKEYRDISKSVGCGCYEKK